MRPIAAVQRVRHFGRMERFVGDLDTLIEGAGVPGISVALVNSKGVDIRHSGIAHAVTRAAVNDETVFDAASLSKPVFAYAVLQLIDCGHLSLGTSLSDWVPEFTRDDPQAKSITVAHALCHTTGLPNWRSIEFPLRTYFIPGERFSYSGEGYTWLQRAVERILQEPLEVLVNRLVFEPLGMAQSSYVWRPDFETNFASPHDYLQNAGPKRRPLEAMAAYSLHTTAADFARFLQAVLAGAHLRSETASLWLAPHVPVQRQGIIALRREETAISTGVSWGLGWGLEPAQGTFFHWGDGDQGRHKTFTMGSVSKQAAMVALTNGTRGMAIMPKLIEEALAGDHPCFDWLGYEY